MKSTNPLFKKESLDFKRDTWLGEVVLIRPVSFAALASAALFIALLVLAYLIWGEYTKKSHSTGYLIPNRGLIKIISQQVGVISTMALYDGQRVKKGDVLAVISTERTSLQGNTQLETAKQLALRKSSLTEEKLKIHLLYAEQTSSARKRLAQLQQEQTQLGRAAAAQQQRIQLAELVVERNTQLFESQFVSELTLQEKRADLLDQQNRLRDLERSKIASERDAVALQAELNNFPLKEHNDVAAVDRSLAELAVASLDNEARREFYVLAPQDGVVTALQADVGKQANPNQPMMSLIPLGTQLQADLYVPSRAVGFVRVGSVAQLQYQAFPYQKFGSYPGKVVKISRTSVPAQELPFPAPATEAYYVVTVQPESDKVLAYGKPEPLQVGMQVDADIWLDRRTLLEWIFEPLYSVTGRL